MMQAANRRAQNEHKERSGDDRNPSKADSPPNSRIFIVCGKNITEDEFRECFGAFGTVEEVWVLKDRGIAYIKFSKTSEAALAVETMNGRCLQPHPRPLKVMIANSRGQSNGRDITETERCRLFLVVPKSLTEEELKLTFSEYGDVDYVSLVKDRNTNESKGFAYVKYHRMSHAAKAFENCDRSFKPVFAEPKPSKSSNYESDKSGGGAAHGPGSTVSSSSHSAYDLLSFMDSSAINPEGCCNLIVSAAISLNQDQVWRLFDLVPGLDYCERMQGNSRNGAPKSMAGKPLFFVAYNNPQSAAYAKEKLHGFEYPPGHRLVIKYETPTNPESGRPAHGAARPAAPGTSHNKSNYELAQLSETIANATAFLQAAGFTPTNVSNKNLANQPSTSGETYDPSYCSVKLPPPQPLSSVDSPIAERLFVVCTPVPPPLYALRDVFGRFGNLIDIYLLQGKTCGYAKYSDKESANRAVTALHGQEVCGSRLKVMTADPHGKNGDNAARKRPKVDT